MRLLGESMESRPQLAHDEGSITLFSKSRGVPCRLRRGGKLGARQGYDEAGPRSDGRAVTMRKRRLRRSRGGGGRWLIAE